MLVTEAEAEKRSCPITLSIKSKNNKPALFPCIGQVCMAWRWHDLWSNPHVIYHAQRDRVDAPEERPAHVPMHYVWVGCDDENDRAHWASMGDDSERRGFCGMAGPVKFPEER